MPDLLDVPDPGDQVPRTPNRRARPVTRDELLRLGIPTSLAEGIAHAFAIATDQTSLSVAHTLAGKTTTRRRVLFAVTRVLEASADVLVWTFEPPQRLRVEFRRRPGGLPAAYLDAPHFLVLRRDGLQLLTCLPEDDLRRAHARYPELVFKDRRSGIWRSPERELRAARLGIAHRIISSAELPPALVWNGNLLLAALTRRPDASAPSLIGSIGDSETTVGVLLESGVESALLRALVATEQLAADIAEASIADPTAVVRVMPAPSWIANLASIGEDWRIREPDQLEPGLIAVRDGTVWEVLVVAGGRVVLHSIDDRFLVLDAQRADIERRVGRLRPLVTRQTNPSPEAIAIYAAATDQMWKEAAERAVAVWTWRHERRLGRHALISVRRWRHLARGAERRTGDPFVGYFARRNPGNTTPRADPRRSHLHLAGPRGSSGSGKAVWALG